MLVVIPLLLGYPCGIRHEFVVFLLLWTVYHRHTNTPSLDSVLPTLKPCLAASRGHALSSHGVVYARHLGRFFLRLGWMSSAFSS